MPERLKQKTVNGVLWSAVERFSVQGVQFFIMIIMARLLMPRDYGLIGMLAIFIAIAQSLVDSGFSNALLRKQNRTEADNSTVFYFNFVISLFLYAILFLAAPLVADFYDIPELCPVMRVVCISIIINALVVVQRTIFTARLDFKTQTKASLTAVVLSGMAGVAMAYSGKGVWSLVTQQLLNLGINTLMLWLLSNWRPKRIYSWKSFRELFAFGSKLMVSGLLNCIYNNIYPIIIGKVFSASDLGYYTRAHHFGEFPSSNVTSIIQKVTYPVLCKLQDDDERLAVNYRRLLKQSAYIIFPLMMLMSALSRPMIDVLIGTKWDFCSVLLTIICFSMMWYPIHAINLNLLQVKGRSDLFLKLEIIKKCVGVCILCITVNLGLIAMCFGQIVSSMIALIINTYYTGRLINVGYLKQMGDLAPTLVLCAVTWLAAHFVSVVFGNSWIQLIVGGITGLAVYLIGSRVFRFKELQEIVDIINSKRNRNKIK